MNEEESHVGKLNDTLYSRTKYKDPLDERTPVTGERESDAPKNWSTPDLDDMLKTERRQPRKGSFMKKMFILAIAFFVSAIAVAGYIFFGGANFVSSKNVDITVLGPVSVSAGDVLELGITVTNKNNADLEVATLSIQYPQGTRSAEDSTQSLTYSREALGGLRAGGDITKNPKAILFGEKGEVKTIRIIVEYKVKGSNATFQKDKIYEIAIGDTPVSIKVSEPSSVASGEPFETTITLSADSSELIKNVMVRGEYPYGYSVLSSAPPATGDKNVWMVGDMAPGDTKTITLKGQILGEDNEERTFRFYVGIADAGIGTDNFKTTLASVSQTLSISRSSLGLNLALNGDSSGTYVAPAGKNIQGVLTLSNNQPSKIFHPRIEVVFQGAALDKQSVQSQGTGFYDSQGNKITWNLQNSSESSELSPGENARVSFSFASLVALSAGTNNQQIILNVIGSGEDINGNQISVRETRTIRIASQASISARALYSRGPFTNKGPIPPKVEKETTYSVVTDLKNTQNDITGAKVTMTLGSNVKWLGETSPAGENVKYDATSNTVTWNVGTLVSGAGFSTAGREAVFKVALNPSLSQVGSAPVLATGITLSGTDSFTNTAIRITTSPITTAITTDPKYVQGDGVVVR